MHAHLPFIFTGLHASYLFAGQDAHDDWPPIALNWPFGHVAHERLSAAEAAAVLNLPAGQSAQRQVPLLRYLPAGHVPEHSMVMQPPVTGE